MSVKYKPKDTKDKCFGLCQFCFWYDEDANACDLFRPLTDEEKSQQN